MLLGLCLSYVVVTGTGGKVTAPKAEPMTIAEWIFAALILLGLIALLDWLFKRYRDHVER